MRWFFKRSLAGQEQNFKGDGIWYFGRKLDPLWGFLETDMKKEVAGGKNEANVR